MKNRFYWRQMQLLELSRDWKDAPTAVIDHGANPGLISHFVKEALLDIAARIIFDKKASVQDEEEITQLAKDRDFPRLAKKLGIKVIHCSERDTQIANRPKEVNEFVGTWSIEGLREEGTAPAEIGWGHMSVSCHPWRIYLRMDRKTRFFCPKWELTHMSDHGYRMKKLSE